MLIQKASDLDMHGIVYENSYLICGVCVNTSPRLFFVPEQKPAGLV